MMILTRDPKAFREETRVFRDRFTEPGKTWKAVLAAYDGFYSNRSETQATLLYHALDDYLVKHGGGNWSKIDRETKDGLLQALHSSLKAYGKALREDIVNSRYGVLYVLANVDIPTQTSIASALLELFGTGGDATLKILPINGISSVAANGLKYTPTIPIPGHPVTLPSVSSLSTVSVLSGQGGAEYLKYKAATSSDPHTAVAPAAAAPPAAISVPIPSTMDKLLDVGTFLSASFNPLMWGFVSSDNWVLQELRKLWETIKSAVKSALDAVVKRFSDDPFFIFEKIPMILGSIVKVILHFVMQKAVPFVGHGVDIGTGAVKVIGATADKIKLWWHRREFTLVPGHPELMARSIEKTVTQRIGHGLLQAANGAVSLAGDVLLPGIGTLWSACAKGIAWGIGFLSKIFEDLRIKSFLEKARNRYSEERAARNKRRDAHLAAQMNSDMYANRKLAGGIHTATLKGRDANGVAVTKQVTLDFTVSGRIKPKTEDPPLPSPYKESTFLNDNREFAEFFKLGCKASPLIPMLILRSHVCGSLMSFMKLTTVDGELIHKERDKMVKMFDHGQQYFDHLKRISLNYMRSSGFNIVARPPVTSEPLDKFIPALVRIINGDMSQSLMSLPVGPSTVGARP